MSGTLKKLSFILIFIAACALALFTFGCSTYNPPQTNQNNSSGGGDEEKEETVQGNFTVSLVYFDGLTEKPFTQDIYAGVTRIRVRWESLDVVGSGEVHTANFNKSGKAGAFLDGDYKVSLVNIPEGYTCDLNVQDKDNGYYYDPYGYVATNSSKHVDITLYKIKTTEKKGSNWSMSGARADLISLGSAYGAYRFTFNSASDAVRFTVAPGGSKGKVVLASLVDVAEDKINPVIYAVGGSIIAGTVTDQAVFMTLDGGMNVVSTGGVGQSISAEVSQGNYTKNFICGQEFTSSQIFNYMLRVSCSDAGSYPVTVDLLYRRDESTEKGTEYEIVTATEDFTKTPETPEGHIVFCGNRRADQVLTMGDIEKHEDGYYYYKEGGERIYAKMFGPGNIPPLDGTLDNYMTYSSIRGNGKDYDAMAREYRRHVNSDGCYPVNDELREMLQTIAVGEAYFCDGTGWAEENCGYQSDERSQWMWACCYYA